MLSDFLSPFLELDEEFCKNLAGPGAAAGVSGGLEHSQRVLGFQRRHSLCPVTLPNSKFNAGPLEEEEEREEVPTAWGPGADRWARDGRLPGSALGRIPFRVDRSVSMIEGRLGEDKMAAAPCRPPPGLGLSAASLCSSSLSLSSSSSSLSPPASTRYKTELCRTYEESGVCKYGSKCQFAHGEEEVRGLHRHPKYKSEPCRTFHTVGFCPYGARCHFIHNADEMQDEASCAAPPRRPALRPPLLRHSFSFAGFPSSSSSSSFSSSPSFPPQTLASSFQPAPPSLLFSRASSVSPPPSSSSSSSFGSPELLSPLFSEPGVRKNCPFPFPGASHPGSGADPALRFYALTDAVAKCHATSSSSSSSSSASSFFTQSAGRLPPAPRPPGLQRCSSADSLSEEGYTSSCSLSSGGSESPCFEGRRLPIFSRLSVTDE